MYEIHVPPDARNMGRGRPLTRPMPHHLDPRLRWVSAESGPTEPVPASAVPSQAACWSAGRAPARAQARSADQVRVEVALASCSS